jgi:hypothetical protein
MAAPTGNPAAVRVGAGRLLIAPLESTEPTNLSGSWHADWTELGYTDEGSVFTFDSTYEDVTVEEELDPILTEQTARVVNLSFAAAELTARNLQIALNGGDITTTSGVTTFEPPGVGDYTHVMIGWESNDGLERWIFRKCLQVGNVEIARRRAPNKATLPMQFRALKPADATVFTAIFDADYDPATPAS